MTRSLPASLLKRVAEAADGYRTGENIWCVADIEFPHETEVFLTESEADRFRASSPEALVVFGPFNSTSVGTSTERPKVQRLTVEILEHGQTQTLEIDVDSLDCLFWSEAALDKFVFPYYAQLLGVDEAAKMRARTLGNTDEALICGHTDGTRWLPRREL